MSSDSAYGSSKKSGSALTKRGKLVLITLSLVIGLFGVLYVLTENENSAPFVYSIF